MDKLITSLDQVTPVWLTKILQEKGVLHQGKVIQVRQESSSPFSAIISRLDLERVILAFQDLDCAELLET